MYSLPSVRYGNCHFLKTKSDLMNLAAAPLGGISVSRQQAEGYSGHGE
jgi:hypothetical protein